MVKWNLVYIKQAQKDAKKITTANLKDKTIKVLNVLEENPFTSMYLSFNVPPAGGSSTREMSIL